MTASLADVDLWNQLREMETAANADIRVVTVAVHHASTGVELPISGDHIAKYRAKR